MLFFNLRVLLCNIAYVYCFCQCLYLQWGIGGKSVGGLYLGQPLTLVALQF